MYLMNIILILNLLFKEYKIKKFEVYRGFTNSYTNELVIMNY